MYIFFPSHFSEEIKYFPLSCVHILCDFHILFKRILKKSIFAVFQFEGCLLNMKKNILLQGHFLSCRESHLRFVLVLNLCKSIL